MVVVIVVTMYGRTENGKRFQLLWRGWVELCGLGLGLCACVSEGFNFANYYEKY